MRLLAPLLAPDATTRLPVALVLVVLIIASALTPSADATVPGANGKIAFESYDSDLAAYSIYWGTPGADDLERVATSPGGSGDAAWSPDGRRLVYDARGIAGRDSELFLLDTVDMTARRLTDNDRQDWFPTWSPTGNRILFVRKVRHIFHVYLMRPRPFAEARRIRSFSADVFWLDWSPDGRKIAFIQTMPDGGDEIFTMRADGSRVRRLTYGARAWSGVSWSPDAKKIAFSSYRYAYDGATDSDVCYPTELVWGPCNYEIFVISADGSREIRLTDNEGVDMDPVWSPDGKQIAYVSDQLGRPWNVDIFTMDPDGSDQTRVIETPGFDYGLTWQALPR